MFRALHEWFAERIPWVQYPNVRLVRPPFFAYRMHWEKRALLILVGIAALLVGLVGLLVAALVVWAILA